MLGFGKLSLIFYGSSDADAVMWAGGGEAFILVDSAPPFAVDQ